MSNNPTEIFIPDAQTGLRDYFAGQALTALLQRWCRWDDIDHNKSLAKQAYGIADALLEARKNS